MTFDLAVFQFLAIKIFLGVIMLAFNFGLPAIATFISVCLIEFRRRFVSIIWQVIFIPAAIIVIIAQLVWIRDDDKHSIYRLVSSNFWMSFDEYKSNVKVPVTRNNVKTELKRFELVSWNPPKHFYVTLKEVSTGSVFTSVYVSKHCNAASSLKRGEQYNLSVTEYTMSDNPGVIRYQFNNLSGEFC